jgi:hypothetical protein
MKTPCGQNAEFYDIKMAGNYSNHWTLNSYDDQSDNAFDKQIYIWHKHLYTFIHNL